MNSITKNTLFIVRTANQCLEDAAKLPVPKMLCSEFWHEGELCILFADTNVGKSILAVQIADSISKGAGFNGFRFEAEPQGVLYFDFEMSIKQFENRYSKDYSMHYQFSPNLHRIWINPDCTDFRNFEVQVFQEIERLIIEKGAKILIIDNLTYLKAQATETAREALPLMKDLKQLKIKHDLSILVLAHTPKRNQANPITKNDLAGSKHLANFADSIFAIGQSSSDPDLRYVKQIKARATEIVYNEENVLVFGITKPFNFIGFELIEKGKERDHLRQEQVDDLDELDQEILTLKNAVPNLSCGQIASQLNTNKMRVSRVLRKNNVQDTW